MPRPNKETVFAAVIFLLLTFFVTSLVFSKLPREIAPFIVILAPVIFIITFVNTDIALIILIFSMLLSPEVSIADVPDRSVVVRTEDILLFIVFFSWLAKMAINKELSLLKRTPLTVPIVVYILICILATMFGIADGYVHPAKSFFYLLKYIEYFALYFLVVNNVRDEKQIKIFIAAFMLTCFITCVYALATVGADSGRATAPFEGVSAEPNTLGGYLVFLFAVVTGLFLCSSSKRWRRWSAGLICFMFIVLMHTLSRGSYLAFVFMYAAFVVLIRKKTVFLIGILVLGVLILPSIVPTKVTRRIEETFIPGEIFRPLGREIRLDSSAAARINSWKVTFDRWKKRPLLGYGLSGLFLTDTQYPFVLGESGIIGLTAFIWLMIAILRNTVQSYKVVQNDWQRGLTLGFLAGFIGLLVHAFSADTFIIVRIMEPFWFITAIIMVLPTIQTSSEHKQEL